MAGLGLLADKVAGSLIATWALLCSRFISVCCCWYQWWHGC